MADDTKDNRKPRKYETRLLIVRAKGEIVKLMPEEEALFERLRVLRNSIYDPSCYYTNGTLIKFASLRPATKEDVLAIDSSEDKYVRFGEAFLALIKTPAATADHLSPTELLALARMRRFETTLYRIVQYILRIEHESQWWFQGVPEPIRVKASKLHEESRGVIPREYGLMFVDLKEIITKKWRLFSSLAKERKEDKKAFENALMRLNDIRNRLCHPLRLIVQPITDETLTLSETDSRRSINRRDAC